MYDDLMEKDPKMRKIRAESEVRGEARGEAKMLRKVILSVVKRRFPSLLAIAQQRVQSLTRPDDLDTLFEQIEDASDEATARSLLTSSFERCSRNESITPLNVMLSFPIVLLLIMLHYPFRAYLCLIGIEASMATATSLS